MKAKIGRSSLKILISSMVSKKKFESVGIVLYLKLVKIKIFFFLLFLHNNFTFRILPLSSPLTAVKMTKFN